jgi:hypothetical protein
VRIERKVGASVAFVGALLLAVSGAVPALAHSSPPAGLAQAAGLRFADTANTTSTTFGGWVFGPKTATSVTTEFKVPVFGCGENENGLGAFAIFDTGTTSAPKFNAAGLLLDCAVIGGEAAAVVLDGRVVAVAPQQVFFGDLLQATIVSSATKTTATVKDLTAGHTFTLTRSGAGGAPLEERIGDAAEFLGGHQLPVGDFGKILFTKGTVSGKALGSVTPRSGVNMQTPNGVLQILTGALSGPAKNSFLTTWKHS